MVDKRYKSVLKKYRSGGRRPVAHRSVAKHARGRRFQSQPIAARADEPARDRANYLGAGRRRHFVRIAAGPRRDSSISPFPVALVVYLAVKLAIGLLWVGDKTT